MQNLWLIFLTGLFTGGITCMAVQGGLLTATLVAQEEKNPRQSRVASVTSFLTAKLIAYTALGALFGWLGSFFQLSLRLQAGLLTLVSFFMIGTALALINVHPVFRYFIITPPRFLTRFVRGSSKNRSLFAPAFLGALTIFIPCGTTQAMMALAVGSGKPIWGSLILASFVLGTAPLFFLLGYSVDFLKNALKEKFAKIAATLVLLMALWNLNSALTLSGSNINFQSLSRGFYCTITFCDVNQDLAGQAPTTQPVITFLENRYLVDNPVIPAGKEISLTLKNTEGRGCIQAFTIARLGIREFVPFGQTKTLSFRAPATPGDLTFSCSMGMYSGKFIVR